MLTRKSLKRLLTSCLFLANINSVLGCTSKESQPNPIAGQYGGSATGTINGTVSIIPIPYAQARAIVPARYPILTAAYEELMPGLGDGMYPVSSTHPASSKAVWTDLKFVGYASDRDRS